MLNPFDLKSAILARHAQHVVLIHFPIALYFTGTFFDSAGRIFKKPVLLEAAKWNLLGAAVASVPAAVTGILAWRWALEGQAFKGILRLHFVFAVISILGMWTIVWLRYFEEVRPGNRRHSFVLMAEWCVCLIVALTGHLGGFLSGVNGAL